MRVPIAWAFTVALLGCPLNQTSSAQDSSRATALVGPEQIGGHRVLKLFTAGTGGGLLIDAVYALFEDREGHLWVGGVGAVPFVEMYDERVGRWTAFGTRENPFYRGRNFNTGARLPYQVYSICQGHDGRIWFSDLDAGSRMTDSLTFLTSLDGKNWTAGYFPNPDRIVRAGLFPGQDSRVWFWLGDTLQWCDRGAWSAPLKISDMLAHMEPPPESYRDPEKANRGTAIVLNFPFPFFKQTDNSNGAATAKADVGDLYEITTAVQDRDGYVWMSGIPGIFRLDPQRKELWEFKQAALWRPDAIYEDRSGRIWFGDSSTLCVYDKAKNSSLCYRLCDHVAVERYSPIRAIYQDSNGRLFIASSGGLVTFSEVDGRWDLYDLRDFGLDSIEARCVIGGKSGRIWIAGRSGLILLESNP